MNSIYRGENQIQYRYPLVNGLWRTCFPDVVVTPESSIERRFQQALAEHDIEPSDNVNVGREMQKISQTFSLVLVRAAFLLLVSLPAATARAQSESTPPPFPAPGKLVDIGGWRLHLNCTGEARASQPTVILEAGKGDFSVEWSLVQPGTARFARVCSYDRAGDGWSELGPHPRTFHQIVYELHTLLDKARVKPPLVLVGHSYGGWLVRLYASTYAADVVGMVLVEAGADNPLRVLPDGKLVHSSDLATGRPIPAVKTASPLRLSDIPPGALSQMRAGLQEAVKTANEPPRNKLPADAQRMRTWALGQLGHVAAAVNPFENEELAGLRAERAKSQTSLGDMPLIVLTRGIPEEHGPDAKALEEEHRRDHAAIAAMSRNGKLVIAAHSGHHVQLDEPELVIKSIREVLEAVRK
jgi:pimeloyl-ACP methyl ester carboxylesterase